MNIADLRRLEIDWELTGLLGTHASRSVVADQPGQRGQQRAVMIQRFGHLVVETLVVLAFDAVGREMNSLGDQYSGAGAAVIVAELHLGYRDGKPGYA